MSAAVEELVAEDFPGVDVVASFVVNVGEPKGSSASGGDDLLGAMLGLFEAGLAVVDWVFRRRYLVVVTPDGIGLAAFRRFSTRRFASWVLPPTPGLGFELLDRGTPSLIRIGGRSYFATGRHRDLSVRHAIRST